jgi:hydroxypyruvate reductase
LSRHHIEVPDSVWEAMNRDTGPIESPTITLLGDGRTAAQAVGEIQSGPYTVLPGWLEGEIAICLDRFFARAGPGVTIAVGEPVVEVTGSGKGGRNTHAALLAAQRLAGTDTLFTAFATDGADGQSGTAGALVDGNTIDRGGDPARALANFDSASYLATTGDLLVCPPTGTNVADLWILRRQPPAAT